MKTIIRACVALALVTMVAPAFAGPGTNGIGTNGTASSVRPLAPSAILLPTGERISVR